MKKNIGDKQSQLVAVAAAEDHELAQEYAGFLSANNIETTISQEQRAPLESKMVLLYVHADDEEVARNLLCAKKLNTDFLTIGREEDETKDEFNPAGEFGAQSNSHRAA